MDDIGETGGDREAFEFDFSGSQFTRRGLLQGAAASPVLLSSAAWALVPIRYELTLSLSQNDRLLTIVERPVFDGADSKSGPQKNPTWFIHAVLFGPKAWFDLVKPASDNHRTLKIRNCRFGGHTAEFTFEFSRKDDKAPWFIDFFSSFWNPAEREPPGDPEAARIAFAEFVTAPGKSLKRHVTTGQVDGVLQRIFQDHVRSACHGAVICDVTFDSRLRWNVSAATPKNFSVFGGQAALKEFSFGWRTDLDEIAGEAIAGDIFLAGRGSVQQDGFDKSKVVVGVGHCADLSLQRSEKLRAFEVRVGVSPLDPALEQTVSRLSVGQAKIAIKSGSDTLAGEVTVSDVVVSQTVLPKTRSLRTVVFGNAGATPDPDGKMPLRAEEVPTPIGRLTLAALPPDEAAKNADQQPGAAGGSKAPATQPKVKDDPAARKKQDEAAARKKERELFFRAACGDRGGARQATLWVVDDLRQGQAANTARQLRRLAIDLQLRAANTALQDASFSSLTFPDGGSDIRLIFEDGELLSELKPLGEFPRAKPSSFVWLGHNPGSHLGEIDLTRATLTAARDYDLMKLRFRFFDLVLTFAPLPVIRPARADCRLVEIKGGQYEDSRPVLVAEFDPQHVFEEALFRPEPPPLPDADGQPLRRDAILAKLKTEKDPAKRAEYRETVKNAKVDAEKKVKHKAEDQIFGRFAKLYAAKAATAGLEVDQQVYIGPFGLEADAMHLARDLFKTGLRDAVEKVVRDTFDRVKTNVIADLRDAKPTRLFDITVADLNLKLANALLNERAFEEIEPVYAAFRTFYREERSASDDVLIPEKSEKPSNQRYLWQTEFLSEGNRPVTPSDPANYPTDVQRKEWFDAIIGKFMNRVVGADPIEDLMAARLSGPSRLAFRVNCAPPPNTTSVEAGLHQSSGAGPSVPAGGEFAYDPIPFTFEALTDWSRHEPAVTRRAQKLFTALPWGGLPPLGERAANLSDHDILAFQGFSKGFLTAEQRLGEVRASMVRRPTGWETAIEIPSRLILSTAQDAVWQTVRRLPATATDFNLRKRPPEKPEPPVLQSGLDMPVAGKTSAHQAALWTARLAVEDVNPGLRIVDTPDFRPMVLAPAKTDGNPPLPGRGAPPRGPVAPWFVGPEQMESTTVTAEDVNGSLPDDAPGKITDKRPGATKDKLCPAPDSDAQSLPEKVFQVLKWLCGRADARKATPIDWRTFRTTLDAYDRHQLVMLSSAYGLPVIGRRQSVETDENAVGPLVIDSGQFEPGTDREYALSDARNDQAIYRPIPLNVRELSLTALGGSFSHDTAFQPSAGADDLWGRKLFEGFSIERWQQDIVLGRDVLGQVVYKGYLFPFGHRCSMIKQTERIFLRTPTQGIKAILRQRIFLHVAQPLQRFPAIGQAHRGALWCGESVTLRTIWTPDILDPNAGPSLGAGMESLNGRIFLGAGNPGLAFFPRTDITERGLFSFELLVDGAATKVPLIFVDNIAATTASSLGALVDFYTTKTEWIPRRTLPMNGQKIRYAPENRSGDTTLVTESIQVGAHGRFKDFGGGWAGDLGTYNTTGTLEGARQPPFYPAMDFAIVRLEQVEKFSGGKRKPVKVQYDGHYVRHGFAPLPDADAKGENAQPKWNPMEVFLNLRNIVTSGMGDNGAQAAAIGRPASNIVAVSRAKGPLGADRFVKYETLGYDDADGHAADAQIRTVDIDQSTNPDTKDLFVDQGSGWQRLQSLASYFNHRHELPLSKPGGGSPYDPVEAQPAGPVNVLPPVSNPAGQVLKTLQVLQSYFSGEAKILGTVKIKYLLALLDLGDFLDAVPVLRETVEYGTAASAKVEDEVADLATDVRTRVIYPLLQVVGKLRAQWTALDAKLAEKVGQSTGSGLTLAKLYPEIETGLSDLERALQAASSETDPAALANDLAVVYESGRRFIRVLTTIAANPVERLKDAATRAIDNLVSGFTGAFQSLADFKKQIVDLIDTAQHLTPADLATWILSNTDEDQLAEQLSLTFGQPDLVALANSLIEPLDPDTKTFLMNNSADLNKALPTAGELVSLLVPHALNVLGGGETPDDAARAAFDKWLTDKKPALDTAIAKAKDDIGKTAAIKVEAVRLAALAALDDFVQHIADWISGNIPERDRLFSALIRGLNLFAEVKAVADALRAGDVKGITAAAGVFSSDVFGFDISILAANVVKDYTDQINDVRTRVKDVIGKIPDVVTKDVLARELEGCLKFKNGQAVSLPVKANDLHTPLKEIADALTALNDASTPIADFKTSLNNLPPNVPVLADVPRFHDDVTKLVQDLTAETKKFYCATVQALSLLQEIKQWAADASWTSFDRTALDNLTCIHTRVDQSIKTIETELVAIAELISAFASQPPNRTYLIGGLLLGGGAKVVVDNTTAGSTISNTAKKMQEAATKAEAQIAAAIAKALGFTFTIANDGALFGAQIAEHLQKAVVAVSAGLRKVDRDLGRAADDLATKLTELDNQLKATAALNLATPAGGFQTVKQLLDTKIDGLNMSVKDALADPGGAASKLEQFISVARDAEAKAVSLWHLLQLKIQGAPDQLRQKLEQRIVATGVFAVLAQGYKDLLSLRQNAIEKISGIPLLSVQAKRALIVAPAYGSTCNIEDPKSDPNDLSKCDRLAEEAGILDTVNPLDQTKRNKVLQFFASWGRGTAAPLTIGAHVRDLAAQVLKGDVLSLIDVSAFRDAIEDAIASLIPTRTTLAYDFSRSIQTEPDKKSLFQAQKGTVFALKVRSVVDLLKPDKLDFRATGSLGPFDVKLVGSLIDALTLKFDGAVFEMVGGSSPRFDVAYRDFEIGQDLEFAKKLQSFLSPKDGNGVFLQPLTRTAGIEAGYGIDLGIIGVGVTSFFNVTLNVSAELPFTDSESLFKVSLGRRLRPFTMSVIPFAGSGYFAIFAAPDGIRGFEASFEFGGGASVGFGPLQVQARIMVGVFVRVLRVDNTNSCTIYGTFFAGGSASIWIFSFSASLYVRLGSGDDGTMYGEAIFSFSFSLGIVDYDYSITAFKREQPVGGGKSKKTTLLEPQKFDGPVRFALAEDQAVASDVPKVLYAPPKAKKPLKKPYGGAVTPPSPPPDPSDVVSLAEGPDRNLKAYLSYFDLSLVEGA